MKKLLVLLLVVGMLIVSAGGCVLSPLLYATGIVLVPVILNPDLSPPTEQTGEAWFIDPNDPNHKMKWTDF